jgi:hypothetical protein
MLLPAQRRLNILTQQLHTTGAENPERRGGSRQTEQQRECKASIVDFIKKQKVVESHYCYAHRQYLSHDLSIVKLYKMWVAERREQNAPIAKKTTFDNVFYERFNLGFGQPKTDVCATCKKLSAAETTGSEEEQEAAKARMTLHTLQWKKFYKVLDQARRSCNTLAVSFDLQQCMPLPRTNVTQAFYKRQLWLYNLGIVIHDRRRKHGPKNVFLYSWLESEGGRGANEICSALRDFLQKIWRRAVRGRYRHLHLFSDSCTGQHKNQMMVAALLQYVNLSNCVFDDVQYTFPIVGHSYLPPDRVFGRIEKDIRRVPEIKLPAGYHSILCRHGSVRLYPTDWNIYDFKTLASTCLRNMQAVRIRDVRRLYFKKGATTLHASQKYAGTLETFSILKCSLPFPRPQLVRPHSHVSQIKLKDVCELLTFLALTPEEETFYRQLRSSATAKDDLRHPFVRAE